MSTVREIWGYACPNCKSDEHLQVELTTMADLTADGTDPFGDQHWHGESYMQCKACDHSGIVNSFHAGVLS